MLAVKVRSCFCVNFFLNSTLPAALRATRSKVVLPRSIPTERICISMILLEPANKITHFNVEIKRRTISLTGFSPSATHRTFSTGELAQNATLQAQRDSFRIAGYSSVSEQDGVCEALP